jgi:hypothetical protein
MSRAIIFDKDAKFRFDLWKILFKIIEIDLLTNIVYHSQIDEQSKRTNQIVKIVLRFLLTSNDQEYLWHETLSAMQHDFMNTITFTDFISNQILYDTNTQSQIIMLNDVFMKIENS